ncbi:MAG TPA: hypothetical protein VMU80_18165 [Bryobacteraceae bacterium]|nr:hypothetical protein [Bryobacteraceae bacterium]HUO31155.1 hypothetical protein [Bryobacteraceae bacterium]
MPSDDLQPDESGASPAHSPESKAGRALSRVKRELTDEELASPGALKMILEEIERQREETAELRTYRDKFYESDKKLAIINEKVKGGLAVEIVSTACLAVGAAAIGYAPATWSSQPSGWITLAFGAVLILGGIISKAVRL